MTLDEAIRHAEEVAEDAKLISMKFGTDHIAEAAKKCANEHRQLAEWLRELKRFREMQTDGDLISRKAAVDIERNATVDTNPSHFEAHQKFEQFMDDAEISSFGRWQWSNGFNTALTAVGIDLEKLPSADRPIG